MRSRRAVPAPSAARRALRRVAQQAVERAGEGHRVLRRHDEHHLAEREPHVAHVARDRRQPRRHGLDEHERQRLDPGRDAEHVALREQRPRAVLEPEEAHREPGRLPLERRPLATLPADQHLQRGAAVDQPAHGVDQHVEALLRGEPSERPDDGHPAARRPDRLHRVHAVDDVHDAGRRNAQLLARHAGELRRDGDEHAQPPAGGADPLPQGHGDVAAHVQGRHRAGGVRRRLHSGQHRGRVDEVELHEVGPERGQRRAQLLGVVRVHRRRHHDQPAALGVHDAGQVRRVLLGRDDVAHDTGRAVPDERARVHLRPAETAPVDHHRDPQRPRPRLVHSGRPYGRVCSTGRRPLSAGSPSVAGVTSPARGRDAQRARVYRAEDAWADRLDAARRGAPLATVGGSAVLLPAERRLGSLEAAAAYCGRVLALDPVVAVAGRLPPPQLRPRRGLRSAHWEPPGVIALPLPPQGEPWALREAVVLHELAHHVAELGGRATGHRPPYPAVVLLLAEAVLGPEAALALRVAYGEQGVQVGAL